MIATLSVPCVIGTCDTNEVLAQSTTDGVSMTDLDLMRERLVAGLSYRVYDGLIVGNMFSFWVSNNELWRDWCTSQSPQAVDVDGKTGYACSSGGAPFTATNPRGANAAQTGRDSLCKIDSGACSCNETRCRWNAFTIITTYDLMIDTDGLLRGSNKTASGELSSIEFTRTSEVAQ
jgi:hypothetical protein